MDVDTILAELRQEREQILKTIQNLEQLATIVRLKRNRPSTSAKARARSRAGKNKMRSAGIIDDSVSFESIQ